MPPSNWHRIRPGLLLLLIGMVIEAGCATPPRGGTVADSVATSAVSSPDLPPDSLVLRTPEGVEVWFTDARRATAPSGESCFERALQVRQDSLRRGVPLLYTREAPTPLGKDAMRAVLYNHCAPVAAYRVDFATISPKRLAR